MTDPELHPHPGPQMAFLSCDADVAIYGGAAGGGKSWGMLLDVLYHVKDPLWRGVYFRRKSTELTKAGGIFDEAVRLYFKHQGRSRGGATLDITWPSGARLQFSHLQHKHDVHSHQSSQYATIYFDELTQFEESQFWYLLSRNRSTCGCRPYVRAATNPDPDSWVRKFIAWWIDDSTGLPIPERAGVRRFFVRGDSGDVVWADTRAELGPTALSFTFIPARLEDNPALEAKDPLYRTKLLALPRVEREQLLGGNWNIRPSAGLYFKRGYFEILDAMPSDVVASVRAWDEAATQVTAASPDPDWTAGVALHRCKSGRLVVSHVERLRGSPLQVETSMRNVASQDGRGCRVAIWQDPGQAGKTTVDHKLRNVLAGYDVHVERASKDKVTYAGPVSSAAEHGNIALVRGPWNEAFIAELESFPDGAHDDQVDALSLAFLTLATPRAPIGAVPFKSPVSGSGTWAH